MKLTRDLFTPAGVRCAITPTWITNGWFFVARDVVTDPNPRFLGSPEAMEALMGRDFAVIEDEATMFQTILKEVADLPVEQRVSDRIFRATPTIDLVYVDPHSMVQRAFVDGFNLWGKTLLSAKSDGMSTLYLFDGDRLIFGVMPCKPEDRFRFTAPEAG